MWAEWLFSIVLVLASAVTVLYLIPWLVANSSLPRPVSRMAYRRLPRFDPERLAVGGRTEVQRRVRVRRFRWSVEVGWLLFLIEIFRHPTDVYEEVTRLRVDFDELISCYLDSEPDSGSLVRSYRQAQEAADEFLRVGTMAKAAWDTRN